MMGGIRLSGGSSLVAMMQPAHLRQLDDCSERGRLNGSGGGRVFLKRQMSPGVLVVFEVCLQNAPQGSFIEYD